MTVYLYNKIDGRFLWEVSGSIDIVMLNITDDKDFTLTPYPLDGNRYKWDGSEWVKVETN